MMLFSRCDSRVTMSSRAAVILVHLGNAGKHADRTGNGRQRIANFVRDGRGQASDGRQPVLHADFALQAADFGKIVEHVDVTQFAALGHGQGGDSHPNCFAKFCGRIKAHFAVGLLRFRRVGNGSRNNCCTGAPEQFRRRFAPSRRWAAAFTSVMRPSRPVVISPLLIE